MQVIFLDNNATTKLAPEALAKMNEVYQLPLNASAAHQFGRQANQMVNNARKQIKKLLNANSYEVIFTSGATESNNTVLNGVETDAILVSQIEHPAVYSYRPENKNIIEYGVLESGIIDLEDLESKIDALATPNFLVSAMLANNETGAIQPIAEIAKLVHQKGGLLHCDAVQGSGKIPVNFEELNIDFASISAHKIHGPQGVGALLVRKGLNIKPLLYGGGQEKSKRGGTTNAAGIIGFGIACEIAIENIEKYKETEKLRDFLESEITKIAGDEVKFISSEAKRLPSTSYIALQYADSQTQLIHFDLNGICISAGSACSSGSAAASRVLKAMKVCPTFSSSAIRVSLSTETTKEEIEQFIKIWGEFYKKHKEE